MTKEIKKIKNISLANVMAMFYGVIGFFVSVFVFIFFLSNAVVESKSENFSIIAVGSINVGIAVLTGIMVSLITAAIGWIIGLAIAFFYNMFASRLGGLKIELEDVSAKEEIKNNK